MRQQLAAKRISARAAAINAGLPVHRIHGLLKGHSPSLDGTQDICDALGLELYIGTPRVPKTEGKPAVSPRFAAALNLPPDASEDQILGAIEDLLARLAAAEAAGAEQAEQWERLHQQIADLRQAVLERGPADPPDQVEESPRPLPARPAGDGGG